ncbi:MAG: anthranilate synthase component I family protein, partial [Flavobacteriales bacterium]
TLQSFWFEPRFVVEWRDGSVLLHCLPKHEEEGRALVAALHGPPEQGKDQRTADWVEHTPREEYLRKANKLLDHIRRGDIYEVNYCTTRTAQLPGWDPYTAFGRLLAKSDAPFASFFRSGAQFALCASPERFLAFTGDRVVGQPMKGTRPRIADPVEDERIAHELASDPKERSENIMALDVMRNDLSRIAASGTVKVEELCGVHSYAHVHQMVSTVSARMLPEVTPLHALTAAFPMASMTGAPKIRAMQLIDAVEDRCRGLFSGTLGFFAPDGTGDLNVVIRTVLYNAETGQASLSTGSALTATCDPEREWDECVLKARSVIQALQHA